mmetsp:Transcript_6592/g.16629  ORF Transcript_6592/g.16629 Transcript_6592/m.16629 type:complete len:326 (+) Transcript_6592:409-1386(+)
MLDDRLAHGLALLGVLDGLLESTLRHTDCTGSHRRTSAVERTHGDLEALAFGTQAVGIGDHHVLEGDATRVRTALSHVDLLLAHRDTLPVTLHNEGGEAAAGARTGIGARKHEEPAGHTRVGDPHFVTIQDPLVSILYGLCLNVGHIRASSRFRDTVRAKAYFLGHRSQILELLFMGSGQENRHLSQCICLKGRRHTRAAIGQLFLDNTALLAVEADTSVLFRDLTVEQTKLVRALQQFTRVLHGAVQLGSDRDDLIAGELTSQMLDGLLLIGELERNTGGVQGSLDRRKCTGQSAGSECRRRCGGETASAQRTKGKHRSCWRDC